MIKGGFKDLAESKKLQEEKQIPSLADAISLVDSAFIMTEKYWSEEVKPEKADFNEIANYLGTALDVLREINDKGVFVQNGK